MHPLRGILATAAAVLAGGGGALAQDAPVAADTLWVDAQALGLRGNAFTNSSLLAHWADRLPGAAAGVVRDAVWSLSRDTAGMYVDFDSNTTTVALNVTYVNTPSVMWHFPATGINGFDLYAWDDGNATWRWAGTTRNNAKLNEVQTIFNVGYPRGRLRRFRLHFPLYNGVAALRVGVDAGTTVVGAPPAYTGRAPIVWYGTSIAQGGVVSRPGFAFTNYIRRGIGREVYNFGFSGNCLMEADVVGFILRMAEVPEVFVVDCEWNMSPEQVRERTQPLVEQIRAALPDTTIVLVESTASGGAWVIPSLRAQEEGRRTELSDAYHALLDAGAAKLEYVAGDALYAVDDDPHHVVSPTVGGCHPTDLGQKAMGDWYVNYLPTLLAAPGARELRRRVSPGALAAAARPVRPATTAATSAAHDMAMREGFALEARLAAGSAREEAEVGGADVYPVDATQLLVGRPFTATDGYYTRLPAAAKGDVRSEVWDLSQMSTGMAVHFVTDATTISFTYALAKAPNPLWHMPASGTSGVDLFRLDNATGEWVFVNCAKAFPQVGQNLTVPLASGVTLGSGRYALYLPLRNTVTYAAVNVNAGAAFARDPAFATDSVTVNAKKPVLWYGTSIDQGGVATRPGSTYTNILSRKLGRAVLNYGFAGNGKMELNVARYISQIDAALIVIDCLPNLNAQEVADRTVPLVQYFREHGHAGTPIVLAADTTPGGYWLQPSVTDGKRRALKEAYAKLAADENLHLVENSGNELFGGDWFVNPTVGGVHPSDLGMREIANYYAGYLPRLLDERA